MKFFFSSIRLQIIFFALQHSAGIFFCVDGVEKVGIPLLLLATLAAVLGARFSLSCSSTAQPSKWRSVAFYIYICTKDHNRLYCLHICKLLNSLIFIKRYLSTLSFFVIVIIVIIANIKTFCNCSSSCMR